MNNFVMINLEKGVDLDTLSNLSFKWSERGVFRRVNKQIMLLQVT